MSPHLIVPFAGTVSAAGQHAMQSLQLPQLDRLLARWTPGPRLGSDEYSLHAPHERALAQSLGWPDDLPDLPFAAHQAHHLGLTAPAGTAWGLLTPVHLRVGTEQVRLTEPEGLQLSEADSRLWLDAVRPLFETEGFTLHWAAPLQWLATHALFNELHTASLDRVVSRNVDPWLPDQRPARLIRRLQNEVQMLLYTHPMNEAREAAGLPTVNSFWLSACGPLPASHRETTALVDDRLRAPALAEDWAAWCEAWRALDAGPITQLLQSGQSGQITLCGERQAQSWSPQPLGLWQRASLAWRKADAGRILAGL